ncbi:MAG: hypothetical protein NZ739_09390, partial [Verrucomicrobiae bacterium]|nr:hypothetical protein [Verrucomicrobiae bacterium]MDW7979781.1 LamG-like jellyroll fold domain-containing protein [Verrucomicrobiales bacterium]
EGVLSPLEIAANYQNGPGAFPPNYGTVTSLVLRVASPIPVNASRPAEVLAGASGLTNTAVDVREMAGVVYTSSNTNVVQVSPDGIVTAKFPGKAIVTAILGSISATQEVEVVEAPTRLAHRYSFDAEGGYVAYDSVGGRHGTLQGGAVQTGGKVILNGAAGTYVELPPYLLHPTNIQNGAVTFVAWITAYPQNAAWTRLFDFGRREGGAGARYIFFAPNNAVNGGSARLAVSDSSPGWQSEDGFNVSHVLGRTNLCVMAVWNPNPTRRFLGLYLDGTLVGSMTTTKPFSAVDNQLSFLGQSLYTADGWFNGEIHEFRIYDGELDRIQLAAVYQAGANNTNFAVGNMVSMILDVRSPTILLSQVRQISCVINFQYVTNINLIGDPNLTLRTSDTNVLSVTSGGLLRAHRLGTATLTAEYRYVTKQATNVYTVSTNITVILQPCTLAHRYSFNEGSGLIVYDLVGSAHGQIKAGTNTLGVTNFVWAPAGQLTINTNTALGAQDTYVELPAGILTGMGSDDVSFEFWATPLSGAAYQRVFDFGSVPGSPTNAAEPNVFFARGPWWAATTPYYDWVNGSLSAGAVWSNGTPAHFVIVHSGTEGTAMIYRDGVLVATSTTQNLPIRSINDIYCFIGRSLYSWPMSKPGGWFDPYWVGSFNEFRMYKGLLTDAEVARHYALGPDQVIANVPLSYAREGNNLVLSWPKYAVHFVLESSPVIGPGATWTPVSGTLIDTGTELRMTVPITGSAQYFRLRR